MQPVPGHSCAGGDLPDSVPPRLCAPMDLHEQGVLYHDLKLEIIRPGLTNIVNCATKSGDKYCRATHFMVVLTVFSWYKVFEASVKSVEGTTSNNAFDLMGKTNFIFSFQLNTSAMWAGTL